MTAEERVELLLAEVENLKQKVEELTERVAELELERYQQARTTNPVVILRMDERITGPVEPIPRLVLDQKAGPVFVEAIEDNTTRTIQK